MQQRDIHRTNTDIPYNWDLKAAQRDWEAGALFPQPSLMKDEVQMYIFSDAAEAFSITFLSDNHFEFNN